MPHYDERWGFDPGPPAWEPCAISLALALTLAASVGCASSAPPVPVPPEQVERLCEKDAKIEGRVGISISPYPCVVVKTYDAMEATKGRGPIQGAAARFFLRTRLLARGVFSTVFGLLGLG